MLVLSRGANDRIVFPALGISIEVLKTNGSRASLGIDAPKHIRVVRHELLEESDTLDAAATAGIQQNDSVTADELNRIRHEHRNLVNSATLKLQLAAKLLSRGEVEQGLASMTAGIAELNAISSSVEDASVKPLGNMSLAEAKSTFTVKKPTDGHRVLLVDDDENERTLMSSYLQRCGLVVDEASDGLKALYALSKPEQPDVVLLDMNMPNLGGRETIKRIRKCSQHPQVPVFAVTAEPIEQTGVTISQAGVSGWFQKPVQVDEIVDAIQKTVALA